MQRVPVGVGKREGRGRVERIKKGHADDASRFAQLANDSIGIDVEGNSPTGWRMTEIRDRL